MTTSWEERKKAFEEKFRTGTLTTSCLLSEVALIEAVKMLGPSFSYNLYVSNEEAYETRILLKRLQYDVRDSPFAAYCNLIVDREIPKYGWFLEANGLRFGSEAF